MVGSIEQSLYNKERRIPAMKVLALVLLAAIAYCSTALCAESTLSTNALLLARWIAAQQYSNPQLPSCGALKVFPEPSFIATNGEKFCRASPYYCDLAVLGLLRAKAPESTRVANRWIDWYFAHINTRSAPDGVPYEHFYHPDGTGETTCVQPGNEFLCNYNDATDSAAATFFSVLWAARSAECDSARSNFVARQPAIEKLAEILLKLQQTDGLCWAKADYHVEYTEDNSEVFAGLRDVANLERDTFHDTAKANFYQQAAEKVRSGILRELYDSHSRLFRVAKFETRSHASINLNQWYADTQAQFWPTLWGVISPDDLRTRGILSAVDAQWNGVIKPDWATQPDKINDGWIEAGAARSAMIGGDTNRVRSYVKAVEHLKFATTVGDLKMNYPFDIGDASWFLQILAEMPQT
jgi:hypothetical protein